MNISCRKLLQALDLYSKKEQRMHTQFKIMFKKHAIVALGCEEECLDSVLSNDYTTFFEIPLAMMQQCRC